MHGVQFSAADLPQFAQRPFFMAYSIAPCYLASITHPNI